MNHLTGHFGTFLALMQNYCSSSVDTLNFSVCVVWSVYRFMQHFSKTQYICVAGWACKKYQCRNSQKYSSLIPVSYILNEHGDWLHPRQSLCHPTNLCYCFRVRHRNIPSDFQKFPEYISNFPEFSRIKKIPEFPGFTELQAPLSAHLFSIR